MKEDLASTNLSVPVVYRVKKKDRVIRKKWPHVSESLDKLIKLTEIPMKNKRM